MEIFGYAVDMSMLLHYLFVLFMLVFMEGILSADNALVLAVLVRPLPPQDRSRALFYGLVGAFILRFAALFAISYLANVWQAQAIGALYLIFIASKNLYRYHKQHISHENSLSPEEIPVATACSRREFWLTVLRVELSDIAFAIDSILAAVAIAMALTNTGWGTIGGMDAGKFLVVFIGGMAGIILMRFAAQFFVSMLDKHPKLEVSAFLLVLWVGIKLAIVTLAHPAIAFLPHDFPESTAWQVIFFGGMIAIATWGWFTSTKPSSSENKKDT